MTALLKLVILIIFRPGQKLSLLKFVVRFILTRKTIKIHKPLLYKTYSQTYILHTYILHTYILHTYMHTYVHTYIYMQSKNKPIEIDSALMYCWAPITIDQVVDRRPASSQAQLHCTIWQRRDGISATSPLLGTWSNMHQLILCWTAVARSQVFNRRSAR